MEANKSQNKIISSHYQSHKNIKLVESDMKDEIENNKTCNNTAFAHCISSDFDSNRQMSAGVAAVFKEKFGKPLASDRICEHLTRQIIDNGPTVYGLVTKTKFLDKPLLKDYDLAFKKFSQDFKVQKLSKLICSPMGCIRDNIPPKHFAERITQFQISTGSQVIIVVKDEKATRSLRRGLKFPDFMSSLKTALDDIQSKTELLKQNKEDDISSDLVMPDLLPRMPQTAETAITTAAVTAFEESDSESENMVNSVSSEPEEEEEASSKRTTTKSFLELSPIKKLII